MGLSLCTALYLIYHVCDENINLNNVNKDMETHTCDASTNENDNNIFQ